MNIRPMRLEDIPRVMEIADALTEAPRWSSEIYARALDPARSPGRIALVAEDSDGVVGFLVAALIPPQAELESIAVAENCRRQGIAHRLCITSFDLLKQNQATQILLEVRESNHPARSLYASLGFIATGRRPAYYSDPQEDAILLHLLLS